MNNKVLDNKCPSCSAPIFFNPKLGEFKCEYCGSAFSLEEMQEHNNASSTENNKNIINNTEENVNYVEYNCKNCGAAIIADEQTAATFCVYCGNTAILQNKLSNAFAPDKVIPFKKEKQTAIDAFKNITKGRPLAPKDFNKEENIAKIKGVYIPFWLFDLNVSGDLNCSAQKVRRWTTGNREYTNTKIFKVLRSGSMSFEKIPVDGSTRFADDIMNTIEPFNYEELENYNHAYLSGFYAEKYDIESEKAYDIASKRGLESAKDVMYNDSRGYTSKQITSNTLTSNSLKKEYALLPVWMVNIKYKDKMYLFAMNGQTGEFIGNIPLDVKKTIIYAISIFIISVIIGIIGTYIYFLIGA